MLWHIKYNKNPENPSMCGNHIQRIFSFIAEVMENIGLIRKESISSVAATNNDIFVGTSTDFSCEDLGSQDVYHTKEENEKNIGLDIDNLFIDRVIEVEYQFGVEPGRFDSILRQLSDVSGIRIDDRYIDIFESIALLMQTLRGCTDVNSQIAAVTLFVHGNTSGSFTRQVINHVLEIIPQSGSEEEEEWINQTSFVKAKWSDIRRSNMFPQISRLLGVIVSLGVCKATDLTFKIGDIKILSPDLKKVHDNAFDLLDAALETVLFFVENGYLCWKSKSFAPLLMSDSAAQELDIEYSTIIRYWSLVQQGNLKRQTGVEEYEFDHRLEKLSTKVRTLMKDAKGYEHKLMTDKFSELLKIRNEYTTFRMSCGVREAPFCIEFFGPSSQGKTTACEQITDALLFSQGMSRDKIFQAPYNASDKFMSNWTTDKLVLAIDDMANEKADFVERPPTRVIVDVCNNQPFSANMAELDLKGKVFVQPKIVTVTTNVKHLDARVYSNCPYSIQRRMHAVVTVKVKPEFADEDGRLDSTKVDAIYAEQGYIPAYDDLWLFTVEKAVQPSQLRDIAAYVPIVWRQHRLVDIQMKVLQQYLVEQFEIHRRAQVNIVDRMQKRNDIEQCPYPGCKFIRGYCDEHDKCYECDKQFGIEEFKIDVGDMISDYRFLYRTFHWLDFIPRLPFDNPFRIFVLFCSHIDTVAILMRQLLWIWIALLIQILVTPFWPIMRFVAVFSLVYAIFISFVMTQDLMHCYRQRLIRVSIFRPIARLRHETKVVLGVGLTTAFFGLCFALKLYKNWRIVKQGALEPKSQFDIDQRDAEKNVYAKVVKRELPVSLKSKCVTLPILEQQVLKNLVYGTIDRGSLQPGRLNGLFLMSNVILINYHYFTQFGDNLRIIMRKDSPDAVGGKFKARLSMSSSIRIPDTDFSICWCTTGGSFPNIVKYMPLAGISSVPFKMLWRQKDGYVKNIFGKTDPKIADVEGEYFEGGYYKNLSENTFGGLCGAPLLAQVNSPCIIGIHIGGLEGTKIGSYGALFREEVVDAIDHLRKLEGVNLTGSAEHFEQQVYGKNVIQQGSLHPKSPMNYLPKDAQFEYYGSCVGRSTSQNIVKVTPISEHVMEICDSPNIYCAPEIHPEWKSWQACLENASHPAEEYDYDVLKMAILDYKDELIQIFENPLWNNISPLSDKDNWCGMPGIRFIDPVPLDTSPGIPLTGKKRDYVYDLPPTEDRQNNRIPDMMLVQEIERLEKCYENGERGFPVAKACKKLNEILTKAKCRTFFGNPVAFTYEVRKYFLPIIRVLQMNPLKSECAVGINCHGPEWDEFYRHATKFGTNRLFGGDYGKYDQKLPAQLLLASLRILMDFAQKCNYSERDIRVMEAMSGDLVYAMIAFNGDLIGLTSGTHISGNSLTVVLNGICGSLNLRAYYYSMYPYKIFEERRRFRQYVAAMTYGDDNIGSVSPFEEKFTIKGLSRFLGEYGQIYTMPDKESELLDFLPEEEFEFLKRKSVKHDSLSMHVGALVEKSIFKSLHMFVREKGTDLSEDEACAINIDGALREWFNHGREIYELRRQQMIKVANKVKITHMCNGLNASYDDLVIDWQDKYIQSMETGRL